MHRRALFLPFAILCSIYGFLCAMLADLIRRSLSFVPNYAYGLANVVAYGTSFYITTVDPCPLSPRVNINAWTNTGGKWWKRQSNYRAYRNLL